MTDKCIFVAEDNDAHAEIISRCLKKCEVHLPIVRASNGEEAKNYLVNQVPIIGEWLEPELVLLDIRLPRISGLEVLHSMREKNILPGIPIVILTSSAAQADIDKAYENCVSSYLVKPMDYTEYITLFQSLTNYWLRLNVR